MSHQHHPASGGQPKSITERLAIVNEQAWISLGNLAESMTDSSRALAFYKWALKHNPRSVDALSRIASLYRHQEQFDKAVNYYRRILEIQKNNGPIWGALGHCQLMLEHWQEAYHAYQQALYYLPNPRDPKLWYGIGILYDRYGSLEYAEEAFSSVIKIDPNFEKANEIYFRLGIIYKQQHKYDLSLQCFRHILHHPPRPLTEVDIWYQMGHVYEQQREYELAKGAYERVLMEKPDDAKVLQQFGWLFAQPNTSFTNEQTAIEYLTRSLKADSNDAQSWYLLGRCYIAQQNYHKAYEAYQQAVYRDARNPAFWCSIGVLYYQINQHQDALDAYNRAIRINPYMSEVWYNLGTLYESSSNQLQDAIEAYQRAAELDPTNPHIKHRLDLLRDKKSSMNQPPSSSAASPSTSKQPVPQDITNPYQYQTSSSVSHPPPPTSEGAPKVHQDNRPSSSSSTSQYPPILSRPDSNDEKRKLPPSQEPSPSKEPHLEEEENNT